MFCVKDKSNQEPQNAQKNVYLRGNKIFKSIKQKILLRFNNSRLNELYEQNACQSHMITYYRVLFLVNIILFIIIILRTISKDIFDSYSCEDSQDNYELTINDIQIIIVLSILVITNLIILKIADKLKANYLNIYNFIQSVYTGCFVVFRVSTQRQCYLSHLEKNNFYCDIPLLILIFLNAFAQREWIFKSILFFSLFGSLIFHQFTKFQIIDLSLSSIMLLVSIISIYYQELFTKMEYYENCRSKRKRQNWLQIFQQRLPIPTIILKADQNKETFKISFVNDQFKTCFNIDNDQDINNINPSNNQFNYSDIEQTIFKILSSILVPISPTNPITSPIQSKVQFSNIQLPNRKNAQDEEIIRKSELYDTMNYNNLNTINKFNNKILSGGDTINVSNPKFTSSYTQQNTQRKQSPKKQDIQIVHTNQQSPSSKDQQQQQNGQAISQNPNKDISLNKYLQLPLFDLIFLFINRCQKRISFVQQINDQSEDLIYQNCIYNSHHNKNKLGDQIHKSSEIVDEERHFDIQLVDCYDDTQTSIMIVLNDISMKVIKIKYDNKRLNLMNDYKDKLLATVSHDLKTPLSAIVSLIESCMIQMQNIQFGNH